MQHHTNDNNNSCILFCIKINQIMIWRRNRTQFLFSKVNFVMKMTTTNRYFKPFWDKKQRKRFWRHSFTLRVNVYAPERYLIFWCPMLHPGQQIYFSNADFNDLNAPSSLIMYSINRTLLGIDISISLHMLTVLFSCCVMYIVCLWVFVLYCVHYSHWRWRLLLTKLNLASVRPI